MAVEGIVASQEISHTTQINEDSSQTQQICSPYCVGMKKEENCTSNNLVYERINKDIFSHVNNSTNIITSNTDSHQHLVSQGVSIGDSNNTMLNLASNDQVQVITDTANLTNVTGENGAIFLLVSHDSANAAVLQTVESQDIDLISANTIKNTDPNNSSSTVQIMNSDGVPVNINVSELLSTITGSKTSLSTTRTDSCSSQTEQNILTLSPSIISTTDTNETHISQSNRSSSRNKQYIISDSSLTETGIPNWALHLRDCTLFGDTYTGYVTNDIEMDAILNLYKKETQSLFAIRQTPSPAKDENSDTVRLMWKSQYVPYDGIPFVNVGRRATVMECEHGPRKRSNALKKMIHLHGHKNAIKKIPNLTCPARLFVKKVRKFPQYRVPVDADPKFLRQLQERSLKLVRNSGFHTGEVRLYMQLPLPTAHRYHHIGNSIEAFQKELDDHEEVLVETLAVDSRVLCRVQELVRQGFVNSFIVRAALKDFVENKMILNIQEHRPYKHNKAFYPPMIEIQNIIQQTQAHLNSGILTPLPAPAVPPVPPRQKRRRTPNVEVPSSPLVKRMKIDPSEKQEKSNPSNIAAKLQSKNEMSSSGAVNNLSTEPPETISLTLTDSQLESFSVTNFTYDQLAQLAKIGLLALNNAAKDSAEDEESTDLKENNLENKTDQDNTVLMITSESDEKSKLQMLTETSDTLLVPTTND